MLEELARIGFSNIYQYIEFTGRGELRFKQTEQLSEDLLRCVAEISESPGAYGTTRRIKLKDSLRALEMLAKHLKLLGENEAEQTLRTTEEVAQSLRYLMEHGYRPPNPVVKMPD